MAKRTRERPRSFAPIVGESLTRQSMADECDINKIMERYANLGVDELQQSARATYGDVSDIPDYQTAIHTVQAAEAHFNALPSAIRERFGNDPGQLLAFVHNPNNLEEGIRLGIFEKPVPQPTPPSDANAATTAAPAPKPATPPGA